MEDLTVRLKTLHILEESMQSLLDRDTDKDSLKRVSISQEWISRMNKFIWRDWTAYE